MSQISVCDSELIAIAEREDGAKFSKLKFGALKRLRKLIATLTAQVR